MISTRPTNCRGHTAYSTGGSPVFSLSLVLYPSHFLAPSFGDLTQRRQFIAPDNRAALFIRRILMSVFLFFSNRKTIFGKTRVEHANTRDTKVTLVNCHLCWVRAFPLGRRRNPRMSRIFVITQGSRKNPRWRAVLFTPRPS